MPFFQCRTIFSESPPRLTGSNGSPAVLAHQTTQAAAHPSHRFVPQPVLTGFFAGLCCENCNNQLHGLMILL